MHNDKRARNNQRYHYLAAGLNKSIQSTSCSLSAPLLSFFEHIPGSSSASSRTRPSKRSTAQRASSYDKDFRSSHHCATFGVQHLHESSASEALLWTHGVLNRHRQAVLSDLGSRLFNFERDLHSSPGPTLCGTALVRVVKLAYDEILLAVGTSIIVL